jgi:hypothetical protein
MNNIEWQNILIRLIDDVFLNEIFGNVVFIVDEEGIELICH